MEIPDGVVSIRDCAFSFSGIQSIRIPDGCTLGGISIFNNCYSLVKVQIGSGTTNIKAESFAKCTALKEVSLPDTCKEIGSGAFSNCSSLEEIELPKNTIRLYEYSFAKTGLNRIEIPDGCTVAWNSFYKCESLNSIEISEKYLFKKHLTADELGKHLSSRYYAPNNIEIVVRT